MKTWAIFTPLINVAEATITAPILYLAGLRNTVYGTQASLRDRTVLWSKVLPLFERLQKCYRWSTRIHVLYAFWASVLQRGLSYNRLWEVEIVRKEVLVRWQYLSEFVTGGDAKDTYITTMEKWSTSGLTVFIFKKTVTVVIYSWQIVLTFD